MLNRFIVVLLFFSLAQSLIQAQDIHSISNQCIVQLNSNNIEQLLTEFPEVKLVETLSKNMFIFLCEKHSGSFSIDELNKLGSNSLVKAIQYNHEVEKRGFVPNDPFFAQQWNMLNTGQLNGKPGADINATEAWAINTSPLTKNGDTIVVAVIDEYFDLFHEDLNFFVNYNEIPNNGIDDDGNGFIDDYRGWNAYNNTGDVYGNGGTNHSTLISGIVGARGNNGKGVAGVVWNVKILPIGGSSTNEAIVIKGYDYVIEMRKLYNATNGVKGAFILAGNSSFGVNNGLPQNFPIWCALYDTMGRLGILNATATTNGNLDVDAVGDIPTTCPSKWMIAVTGNTPSDNRTGGFGLKNIDIAAPAASVVSTAVSNNYTSSTGTSFACPHIAGAIAAMYAEACPKFISDYLASPDSLSLLIKNWLLSSVTKTEALNNRLTTDGRLNLHAAILNTHNYNCNNCASSLNIQSSDILCKNDANGSSFITVNNSPSFSTLWSDGDTTATRNNLSKGLYQLTITDNANCTHGATLIIREPDTLRINSINVVVPVGANPGNFIVNAYGGGDSLQYSLDNNAWQLNNIFLVNNPGTFTVHVRNETGCIVAQQIVVSTVDEVFLNETRIKIYPNPVKDILQIEYTGNNLNSSSFHVLDVTGRLLLTTSATNQKEFQRLSISVSNLPNGCYLLRTDDGTTKPFVVNR